MADDPDHLTTAAAATSRLEELWAGGFGDDYVDRNRAAGDGRRPFWQDRLGGLEVASALEIGCNVGANLRWLAELLGADNVAGVDVNERALSVARELVRGADLRVAAAKDLPYPDDSFDLAFTTGVLIHQPPAELGTVMDEIMRCSRRYVLCGEYYGEGLAEVPYRGQDGALFRQDYGRLYEERFPSLRLIDRQFLSREGGVWDDVTVWLFEQV